MKELLTALFIVLGGFFMFVAALGTYRFPDLFSRMHAAAKASSFGAGLFLAAMVLNYWEWSVFVEAAITVFFVFATTPVATHMIGRAAYWMGVPLYEKTVIDPKAEGFLRADDPGRF
jgi:multicomponent Na+:H+ antiporter subunit G